MCSRHRAHALIPRPRATPRYPKGMAVKCEVCTKAWALKIPDPDGGRRCVAHSVGRVVGLAPVGMPTDSLRTKADIFGCLEEARKLARKRKDPSSMVNAARAAAMVLQIPDPIAPGQEVGGWNVTIVRSPPPAAHGANKEQGPELVADAE